MLKDQENEHHKEETLKTDPDLKDLIQVLHHLVSLFHDLKHPDHSRHSDDFVEFADACDSHQFVEFTVKKDEVEGND